MKKIINFLKSFIGIVIFYSVQIGFSVTFYKVLVKGEYLTNNILYLLMELFLLGLLLLVHKNKIKEDFKDFDNNYKKYLKMGIKAYLLGLLGMIITNLLINVLVFKGGMAYNEQIDRIILFKYPIYATVAIIITGPFIEEIVFRLGFKRFINNKILYYILATLIFAWVHVVNGLSNPLQLLYLLPYGSLSLAFAYTLDKTDNIFSSAILHSIHNTIAVLLIIIINLLGA